MGDIYVCFVCQVEQNTVIPRLGKSIGFDFGLKDHILVAPTEEDDVDMPRFFQQNRNKLKKMQKKVSRKLLANTDHFVKKGKGQAPVYKRPLWECKNIQKCFKEQARLHRKIANQREAYHWYLAYELCSKYGRVSKTPHIWCDICWRSGDGLCYTFLKGYILYVAERKGSYVCHA